MGRSVLWAVVIESLRDISAENLNRPARGTVLRDNLSDDEHTGLGDVTADSTTTLAYWFSDLEASTRLWEEHPDAMHGALARHDAILRDAVEAANGTVVKTTGDGLMAVFDAPADAVNAGARAQQALEEEPWGETGPLRVRVGIHIGDAQPRAGDFYGPAVNRAARVMAAAHGGQILLSGSVADDVGDSLPFGVSLRDLGEHRLKDLAGPEHLFQLVVPGLREQFPALATLDLRPNNLPTQTSVFLGRDAELAELRSLIDGAETRLLTLTGPGGTGKTRLALQAAVDQLDRFEDGLFFVDLAPERDAAGALSAIVRTIGIEGGADDTALDALKSRLADRHMLLLLDNFEQVIDAAAGLAELLQSCPGITAVITSREALRVRGERLYAVAPLSLPPSGNGSAPPIEAVMESEAVRLFIERAVEVRPEFEVTGDNVSAIAAICIHLDGLPLALELAAARLRLFSAEDLNDRLKSRLDLLRGGARDMPDRHQTLRNTIEWSYELLSDQERRLFQLFGAFSGARLEAVEDVAGRIEPMSEVDVIDGLESLVDKSLVRGVEDDGPWFSMLGTIREYAGERLAEDPELDDAARRAHAEHYVELAGRRRPELIGTTRQDALDELARESDNLRAAWRQCVEAEDLESLHELLDTMWVLYDARGWYREVIELANDLLGVLSLGPDTPQRVREEIALQTSVARALITLRGYTAEVEEAFTKALQLSEDAGHLPQRFPVLRSLASLYALRYERDKALEVGLELLAIAEQQDDSGLQVEANLVVGANIAFTEGIDVAMEYLEKAIDLYDPSAARSERFRLGPNPGVVSLTTSALLLWVLGFPERAMERAARAEEASAALDHPSTRAYALHHVSLLYIFAQRMDLVAERGAELQQVANANDYPIWRALALVHQGLARIAFGEVDEGITQLESGMVLYQGETTPPVFWPILLTLQAAGYAMAGRVDLGLTRVDEALSLFRPNDPMSIDASILRADLLMALSEPDVGEAEAAYEEALQFAAEHDSHMAELRATTRLAQLRRGTPGEADAMEALQAIYATFTEGFDTPDLAAAAELLGD